MEFSGPIFTFGCEIKYKPISKDDVARAHKFGDKRLPGIFLGYEQQARGGFSGDLLVADWDEIQEAESFSEIYSKRFKGGEVFPAMQDDNFKFLVAEGNLRQPGGKVTEYAGRTRRPPEKEEDEDSLEEREFKTRGESDEDQKKYDPDYWSVTADVIMRHHRTPRTKLFMPSAVGDCPPPLKYIDVMRLTLTNLDTLPEKDIEDIWYDKDPVEMSSKWIGSTTFNILRPEPRDGYTWVEGRETKFQTTTRPPNIRPEDWSDRMSKKQTKSDRRFENRRKA